MDGTLAFTVTNRAAKKVGGVNVPIPTTINITASGVVNGAAVAMASPGNQAFAAGESARFELPFSLPFYGDVNFSVQVKAANGQLLRSGAKSVYFTAPAGPSGVPEFGPGSPGYVPPEPQPYNPYYDYGNYDPDTMPVI